MEDLGQESNLGRGHRVVVGEEQLQFENTTFVGGLRRAVDLDVEIPKVVFVRNGTDSRDAAEGCEQSNG